MKEWPVVLITGASTGLGLAITKELLQYNFRLVLTAREESLPRFAKEGLEESERVMIRALNVVECNDHEKFISEINSKWGGVDFLINNAGVSYRACLEDMSPQDELRQIQTNYLGPMNLIRLILPSMRKKRKGMIINISSVGGMMAMPTMASYSASKFALEGASESLWYEIRPWNIKITLLEPGFIRSDGFQKVLFSKKSNPEQNQNSPYRKHYEYMSQFIEKLMNSTISKPEGIAKKVLKVMNMKNPPLRIPATIDAWVFYYLRRWLPRWVYHRVLYFFLPGIKHWGELDETNQ